MGQDNRKLGGLLGEVFRDVAVAPRPTNLVEAAKVFENPSKEANEPRAGIRDIGAEGTELVGDISHYRRRSDEELLGDALREALPLRDEESEDREYARDPGSGTWAPRGTRPRGRAVPLADATRARLEIRIHQRHRNSPG